MVFEGTAIEIMTFRLLMAIASSAIHVVSLSRDLLPPAGSANRSLREYSPAASPQPFFSNNRRIPNANSANARKCSL